jgi:hypothetical protein
MGGNRTRPGSVVLLITVSWQWPLHIHHTDINVVSPSTQGMSTTIFESTAVKECESGDITQESAATPKDLRFWLIILGLLIATFISAVDMTGKMLS